MNGNRRNPISKTGVEGLVNFKWLNIENKVLMKMREKRLHIFSHSKMGIANNNIGYIV